LKRDKIVGIIPARYDSSRYPGKAMAMIHGKTIIQRVYEQARKVLEEVCVATDDERIYNHVAGFGKVFMTSRDHRSGTERCQEVLSREYADCGYVINIQGDEPFINPEQIRTLISCLDGEVELATLGKKIHDFEELQSPNVVKVTRDNKGFALYFSRHPIPYVKGKNTVNWLEEKQHLKHIGVYAYRSDILREISALGPSSLEISESLEQLRWLENGYRIKCLLTEYESMGIDTPEDLEKAKVLYAD